MNPTLKSSMKQFIPPILIRLLRRKAAGVVSFTGNYSTWEAAQADATGYDSGEILRRVAAATRKVIAGEAVYERDSVVFDRIEYSWPLLTSLLQVALECGSLRVIDVGGSLGSTWRQNRQFLERLAVPVAWHIVEQENFVVAGQAEFSDKVVRFHRTIAAADQCGADVVLFSSSLCYLPDAAGFLRQAASTTARYLIVDRLPVVAGREDRIALQRVTEPIYPASYPVRYFAEQTLLASLFAQWRLIERWDCDLQPDSNSKSVGFLMEKR